MKWVDNIILVTVTLIMIGFFLAPNNAEARLSLGSIVTVKCLTADQPLTYSGNMVFSYSDMTILQANGKEVMFSLTRCIVEEQ